jgi:hypothetical protein
MNRVVKFIFGWQTYPKRQASSVQVRWKLNWEGTELCGVFWVSSCDVSPSVKWVKVTGPLFLYQYTLFLVGICKTSSSTHFHGHHHSLYLQPSHTPQVRNSQIPIQQTWHLLPATRGIPAGAKRHSQHSTQFFSDKTTQTPRPEAGGTGGGPPHTEMGKLHVRRQGDLLYHQHFQTDWA